MLSVKIKFKKKNLKKIATDTRCWDTWIQAHKISTGLYIEQQCFPL